MTVKSTNKLFKWVFIVKEKVKRAKNAERNKAKKNTIEKLAKYKFKKTCSKIECKPYKKTREYVLQYFRVVGYVGVGQIRFNGTANSW